MTGALLRRLEKLETTMSPRVTCSLALPSPRTIARLREGLDQFQQDNKRRPTDTEVAKLGQSLLLQGTQRGTAGIIPTWLGGGDKGVRAFQTEPGQFAPTVPDNDRKAIVGAYQARHAGAAPSDGQVQEIWMVGGQQALQPRRPAQASPANRGARPNLPMAPADGGTPPAGSPAAPTPQTAAPPDDRADASPSFVHGY